MCQGSFKDASIIFSFPIIRKFILDTDIIPAIFCDHSPILIFFSKEKQNSKRSGFWKFNNSFLSHKS